MVDKFLNIDCFEGIKTIEDNSVDLILEDMPYNTTACDWDVEIDLELYWETRLRISKPTGVVVLTATHPFVIELINSNREMFKYEWIWDKQSGGAFVIAKIRPLQTHENILIFSAGKTIYNPQMVSAYAYNIRPVNTGGSNNNAIPIASGVSKNAEDYDNTKRFPKTVIDKYARTFAECNPISRIHPTQKPVGLFEYLIRTYTNEGDLVFDGFGGSGTTAIAAHKSNRNFIVIEKEQKYYELAKKRLDTERAQLKMF